MKKRNSSSDLPVLMLLTSSVMFFLMGLSSCAFFERGRLVYDQDGIRIGVEADPSMSRFGQPVLNSHPVDLSPKDLQSLLQVLQVSGYSGTLVGLISNQQPVPLFNPNELSSISGPLAAAFREAKPEERVYFSLPKPDVTYSEDRTVGALFFRGPYLHVVLTDHSSFIRTDTGGGEYKDPRDTKGMKLWVAGPAQAAMVSDLEEPRWAPFEKVHISLNVNEVLAPRASQPRRSPEGSVAPPAPPASSSPAGDHGVSTEDLKIKMRELSGANQDLRNRLDEQNKRMQQLQDQLEQLRPESDKSDPNGQSNESVPAR